LPALEYLRTDYTEVWVAGHNVPLVRFADRVRSIAATGIDAYPPRLEALHGFDEIVSWYGSNREEFRDALSQFPVRFFDALPPSSGVHATDFYMRQAGGPDGAVPRIDCPRRDEGFVAIHPFSGSQKKNWPGFRELALQLNGLAQVCAGPEEDWPGAVRRDDLYDLGKWLATARVYVGNDSGITHLAAAVGVPVISIFLCSDVPVWSPRGAQVHVLWQPTADEVLKAVRQFL
jgi:heptosyltransferase III